jgi:hypothetical protein
MPSICLDRAAATSRAIGANSAGAHALRPHQFGLGCLIAPVATVKSKAFTMMRISPLVLLLGIAACGDDADPGGAAAGKGASGVAATADAGTDSGNGDRPPGAHDAGRSDAGDPEAGGFREVGVCGQRSEGTVTADSYVADEEFYLIGEEGFGEELCVVRFEVTRVGDAPPGCDESAGRQQECLWAHVVQYENPTVVTDRDGMCADSELALTASAIAEIEAQRVAYGYVFEFQGHNSVLMTYDYERAVWQADVNAGWDEASGAFRFDRRDGFCGY